MNKRLEHDVQVLISPLLSGITESGHPLKTVHSVYLAESFFIITGISYCEPAFSLITLTNDIL